jgi:hypothetical protein
MWQFLREFGRDWITLMSGVGGVVSSAILAGLSYVDVAPTVHASFIVAAFGCIFFSSYRVWKSAVDKGEAIRERLRTEQVTSEAALRSEIESLKEQVGAMRVERERKPASVHDILDRTLEFAREARRRLHDSQAACDEWYDRANRFVAVAFRKRFAEEFSNRWNTRSNQSHRHRVQECLNWLNGWTGKLSEEHVNPAFTEPLLAEYPTN